MVAINPISQVGNVYVAHGAKKESLYLNNRNKKDSVVFKAQINTQSYEKILFEKYGLEANFRNNELIAKCTVTTTELFNRLFGCKLLPNSVDVGSFSSLFNKSNNYPGVEIPNYESGIDTIYFNSDCNLFRSKFQLRLEQALDKIAWLHPSGNYLQLFVHEFGHSAHFHHLKERGNALVMEKLGNVRIPTAIGRLIAKFHLGSYSAVNMVEFMAERITKDVCNHLNLKDEFTGNPDNLDYSNIFEKKWIYRYSCPQSYLDYYTQQVWNGDTDGADRVASDVEMYLKKLECTEVAPVVKAVETVAKETPVGKSFLSKLTGLAARLNKSYTQQLDKRNELVLERY